MAVMMGVTVLHEAGVSCARAADAYHQRREEICFRLAGAGVGDESRALLGTRHLLAHTTSG